MNIIRILTTLIVVISYGLSCGADFEKIDVPTTATINKIYFDGAHYGWAVTSDGELLSTWDGGKTWQGKKISKRTIKDIDMRGQVGYLTGDRGLIMKTGNRGATWVDMSQNIKFKFIAVGMVNDTSTIVCGTDQNSMSKTVGVAYQTFDSGKTWKKKKHLGNGYTDLVVQPPRKVYLLASKKAFHSISWGVHFFPGKYSGNRLAWGFDFIDDWGFIVGRKGFFARTTDHGRNWEEVDMGITRSLFAVEVFDKYSGVGVGQDGLILYFNDSGDRFTVSQCGVETDLKTVCITDSKIFIGGTNGVMMSKERFPLSKP
ncbi:MAG: YCF48-related protein [candidate division Zixibacteria bacterium]